MNTKLICITLIIFNVFMGAKSIRTQQLKEVYEVNQELLNKISQYKGEKLSGEFRYEETSDKTGELYRLNNSLSKDIGIFIRADLSICTDGAPSKYQKNCTDTTRQCIDKSYQYETAHTLSDGKPLNANKINYLVLPGDKEPRPFEDWGFTKGDMGVIINMYKGANKLIFAYFGEVGPNELIGEASIHASKQLGNCAYEGNSIELSSIDDSVYYVVFKDTQKLLSGLTQENLNQKVTELGIQKMKEYFDIELR